MFNLFLNLFALFGLFESTLQVGINTSATPQSQGAMATIRQPQGDMKVYFVVDRPSDLMNPSWRTIDRLFNQFKKLGLQAKYIELRTGGVCRVYEFGKIRPIVSQPIRSYAAA